MALDEMVLDEVSRIRLLHMTCVTIGLPQNFVYEQLTNEWMKS